MLGEVVQDRGRVVVGGAFEHLRSLGPVAESIPGLVDRNDALADHDVEEADGQGVAGTADGVCQASFEVAHVGHCIIVIEVVGLAGFH